MGAFPLDHEAKQEAFMLLRDEGRAFARACSGHLLVFAEQPHYMMLSLVESDRTVRFDSAWEGDTIVMHASGKRCTVDFVVKQAVLHRDALRDFLNIDRYKALPIYFQEARRNPYDRMAVPADRRFCIDSPVDRTCHA